MRSEALKGHLDMLLLAALSNRPGHGYEVLNRLAAMSGGVFEQSEGTIYPALHRLERMGMLTSSTTMHQGRTRRIYELTPVGRSALDSQRIEWKRFSTGVLRTLEAAQ